jgi:hypothetical protein
MKITQTVFVHYDTYKHCEMLGWSRWNLTRSEHKKEDELIFVGTAEVTFDVPDNFDLRTEQVKVLKAKQEELQAKFSAAVMELNQQISELQAIEYTPSEVTA